MPSYDYLCESNGRIVEVRHRIREQVATWGELCQRADLPLGDTPASALVKRLIRGGHVVRQVGSEAPPPCDMGASCCGGGACGLD